MAPVEPRAILAVRTGPIGNTLAAVPALRALRHRYPRARLVVVTGPAGLQLLGHCPWIDEVIGYDHHGPERSPIGYARLVRRLRAQRPTHAVVFKRFLRAGLLARLSGAPVRVGFSTAGRASFLTHPVPYDEGQPVVDLGLRLAEVLGASPAGRHLEAFPGPVNLDLATGVMRRLGVRQGEFWIAHYGGATTPPVFVPCERFGALLACASQGAPVLLVGTGAGERRWAAQLAAAIGGARLAVDLPLGVVAALMRNARGFVGFSSGPAHLAAAAGIPTHVIFRPGLHADEEIRKWLPPSVLTRALVPPAADDARGWEVFCAMLEESAQ